MECADTVRRRAGNLEQITKYDENGRILYNEGRKNGEVVTWYKILWHKGFPVYRRDAREKMKLVSPHKKYYGADLFWTKDKGWYFRIKGKEFTAEQKEVEKYIRRIVQILKKSPHRDEVEIVQRRAHWKNFVG